MVQSIVLIALVSTALMVQESMAMQGGQSTGSGSQVSDQYKQRPMLRRKNSMKGNLNEGNQNCVMPSYVCTPMTPCCQPPITQFNMICAPTVVNDHNQIVPAPPNYDPYSGADPTFAYKCIQAPSHGQSDDEE